jgi:hypothetical protein
MLLTRSLALMVLCTAQIGHAAFAATFISETPSDASQILEPVARKGTRAYAPDGAAMAAGTQPQTSSTNDALEQCMATWDAGTHITKSNWKTICIRQLKERDTMGAPYVGATKPAH